jgi:hypothetical protein
MKLFFVRFPPVSYIFISLWSRSSLVRFQDLMAVKVKDIENRDPECDAVQTDKHLSLSFILITRCRIIVSRKFEKLLFCSFLFFCSFHFLSFPFFLFFFHICHPKAEKVCNTNKRTQTYNSNVGKYIHSTDLRFTAVRIR